MSGMGEIGENAPNEANFDETMSIVEAQESIQVTANSGALSGLDNGAAQPGEGSTPEQGKAQGSASESGNPEPDDARFERSGFSTRFRDPWGARLRPSRRRHGHPNGLAGRLALPESCKAI